MEKFIVLAGSPNSGKTSTADKVIKKLLSCGYKDVKRYDLSVVLEKDGKEIVVIPYGDYRKTLEDFFERIDFEKYYAVVCCSHATRGKQVFEFFHSFIGELDLNKTQVIPIYKNLLCNHGKDDLENEKTADFIVSLL
ncbi:MAG TPA: hypothetical protein DDW54_00100 [Clostridiales bacterium]|nr:hypothetical protein [Clostridiales bacterium]